MHQGILKLEKCLNSIIIFKAARSLHNSPSGFSLEEDENGRKKCNDVAKQTPKPRYLIFNAI